MHSSAVFLRGGERRAGFLQHRHALFRGEQRLARGVHADGDHQLVGKPAGTLDHVEMAVGDGIEGAGIEGGTGHGEGLAVRRGLGKVSLTLVITGPPRSGETW